MPRLPPVMTITGASLTMRGLDAGPNLGGQSVTSRRSGSARASQFVGRPASLLTRITDEPSPSESCFVGDLAIFTHPCAATSAARVLRFEPPHVQHTPGRNTPR